MSGPGYDNGGGKAGGGACAKAARAALGRDDSLAMRPASSARGSDRRCTRGSKWILVLARRLMPGGVAGDGRDAVGVAAGRVAAAVHVRRRDRRSDPLFELGDL